MITSLIPVKKLHNAKSRLKHSLQNRQREALVITMFSHVIFILRNTQQVSRIYVVTNDKKIEKLVTDSDVQMIEEEGQGLNTILTNATKKISSEEPLLTIFADLPLLKSEDIEMMLRLSCNNDIVISPAKNNSGTNALITKQSLSIPYVFGESSFENFLEEAKKRKLSVAIYKSPSIAFDVDTENDLRELSQYLFLLEFYLILLCYRCEDRTAN